MNLSSCYLFEGLSDSHLKRLEAVACRQTIQEGQWLFHKDEPAERLYIVESGAVELLIEVQGSVEIPVFTIESSALELLVQVQEPVEIPTTMIRSGSGCAGVGTLVEPYRYSLSARCARDSRLSIIQRTDIQRLIHQYPDLGCCVMTNLARKLFDRLNETRKEVQIHFMSLVRSATF
jgi:CRP-like cAMP-binding protein